VAARVVTVYLMSWPVNGSPSFLRRGAPLASAAADRDRPQRPDPEPADIGLSHTRVRSA
jgi:hypothetical protein